MSLTRKQKNVIKKWIANLRSGEYKQGKSALHTTTPKGADRFCCLGVLCDMAVKARVIKKPVKDSGVNSFMYAGEDGVLPNAIVDWVGLSSKEGELDRPTGDTLTSLNDVGDSFKKIAGIIENNLVNGNPDKLFV